MWIYITIGVAVLIAAYLIYKKLKKNPVPQNPVGPVAGDGSVWGDDDIYGDDSKFGE